MVSVGAWQWQYWLRYGCLFAGYILFLKNCHPLGGGAMSGIAGWGVAVAGCSWYRWIEEIKAVRMVPVTTRQWQYWPRFGHLFEISPFVIFYFLIPSRFQSLFRHFRSFFRHFSVFSYTKHLFFPIFSLFFPIFSLLFAIFPLFFL
jgi:hypothetical protein